MTTNERLEALIAKAHKEVTKVGLRACLKKPTRDMWFAAEKLAWNDVPLNTQDCLWLRSQALALPGRHTRGEDNLND